MLISLLLSGVVVFLSHALEAVTGFGSAVLAMPFITALLGIRQGVIVVTILAWSLALYISISKRQHINFRQFGIIAGFMFLGLPMGMFLFRNFDVFILRRILAIFIIVVSVRQLFLRLIFKKINIEAPKGIKIFPYYLLLICGGIIHGIFSTGGPLVVLYASRTIPDKSQFRATLSLLWAVLNTVIISIYIIEGSINREIAGNVGILLPFIVIGIIIGEKLHHKLDERFFSIIVFSILFFAGCFMVFNDLLQ